MRPTSTWRRHSAILLLMGACGGYGCASLRGSPIPSHSPSAVAPKDVLPADLDVVIWLDVSGLRRLWLEKPDQQILRVLSEYGLIAADASYQETAFWLTLLRQSERWWIACRPTDRGCVDAVVYARGRFPARNPAEAPLDLTPAVDLGAGWFRYSRRTLVDRNHPARLYVAPPDRYVIVSPAEIDAVERSLERTGLERGSGLTDIRVEERGLVSVILRAPELGRAIERRAPAAARFLRSATTVKLWLELNSTELELHATVSFDSHERAVLAMEAFALIASAIGELDPNDPLPRAATDVVGNDLVLRLRVTPPMSSEQTQAPEPATK